MNQKKAFAVMLIVLAIVFAFVLHAPGSRATASLGAQPVPPGQKNETVYADTDATGKVNSITVSVHLKTPKGAERLADRSNLESVKSITPGINPVVKGEAITWQAGGEDVYYQGTSLHALPVECIFSYTLDGKAISPGDLAGKSGKVSISAKFTNFDRHMKRINGSLEELFTPFTMITMIELPANLFSDITVDNGKIIDQGDTVMVAGFGLPGLSESLNMDGDALGISDHFTVTATVKDFALDAMTTMAVPGMLTADDIGNMEPLDSLQSGLKDIDSGGKKISDATNAYSSGMSDFNKSLSAYIGSIEALQNKLSELADGIAGISDSGARLKDGAQALAEAINTANTDTANLNDATGQIDSLNDLASSLNDLSQLLASLEPLSNALAALSPEELASINVDPAMVAALQSAVAAHTGLETSASGLQTLASRLQGSLDALSPFLDSLPALSKNTQDIADGLSQLSEGLAQLKKGAAKLSGGLDTLASNGEALSKGSQSLTDNAADIASGMEQYSRGVHDFSRGVNGSVDDLNARKDAVLALGEAYNNFSLLPDGCTGSVRFVFTTEPVKSFE
ncbi:MAG: hypothetical protein ACOYU3_01830 [Bacillota bacterium]